MSNTPKRKGATSTTAKKKKRPPLPTVDTAKQENPWPKRLAYIGGAGFVIIILAAVFFGGGDDDLPDGAPDGVELVSDLPEAQHVEGDIEYDDIVPAGGPHNGTPNWQNCGFYDGQVRPENAVHTLEHGAVWVTYRSDIGQDNIDALRGLTRNRPQLLVSEVPELDTPLRATAWGVRLKLDDYDDVALRQFIVEFTDGAFAPEPAANCQGGVGNPA